MSDIDDIVLEFLVESGEGLDHYDRDLVVLERDPSDERALARIFRTIHTLKGTCGFLGFAKLEQLAHAGESLLARLRAGEISLNSDIADALLGMSDALRQMLQNIETRAAEGEDDYTALVDTLLHLQSTAPEGPVDPSARTAQASPSPAPHETVERKVKESTIRVDVELLDRLMNLVSELVLTRNQLLQYDPELEPQGFLQATQQLNVLTTELQGHVMQTRMRPVGGAWMPLRRVVRDLAHACGKQVKLVLEGTTTELDKTLLEAIKDPITHLVRNAVDHGIEAPAARRAASKPEEGVLTLRSFHEGGLVHIEVSDDGAGLDPQRLKAAAIAMGLLTVEDVERLSDREATHLAFLPGLTTAKEVTNLSGRGVGMDVVKTNIERIGGTIEIQSERGRGATFHIKIPLTLAIVSAQLVGVGGHRFAIAQVNVLEVVRLDPADLHHRIEAIHRTHVYRLRGKLLPLLFLEELLDLRVGPSEDLESAVNIVVIDAHDRTFGLVVDTFLDTQEIVVKPLPEELSGLGVYAGATILGDGSVVLILDVIGLGRRGRLVDELQDFRLPRGSEPPLLAPRRDAMLLFSAGSGRFALPLTHVVRLETLEASAVEFSGSRTLMQHQGSVLPLVHGSEALTGTAPRRARQARWPVIVHERDGRRIGLVVDAILDVVVEDFTIESETSRPGVAGAAVIGGKLTDVVDDVALLFPSAPEQAP